MNNEIENKIPTIITKNGKQLLQQPNGDMIEGIIFTRVYDGLHNEQSYVIAKILVKLKDTE